MISELRAEMKHSIYSIFFLLFVCALQAQNINFNLESSQKHYFKMYGHVHYIQKYEDNVIHNADLDVHRIVSVYGYQFSRNTQFVAEIEYEHAKELFVEQAWVKHKLGKGINLKAGLILVPMGMVNEEHEPNFFYSVERPLLDKNIVPTTWREIGVGITGLLTDHSLKYQLYAMNNVLSFDESSKLSPKSGIRGGRQKGAKVTLSGLPSLAGKLEYFGFEDIKLGISAYVGNTNTTIGDGETTAIDAIQSARDSSIVTMGMLSAHGTYSRGALSARAQYTLLGFGQAERFNTFASANIPEMIHGYYTSVGYKFYEKGNAFWRVFARYSKLNHQLKLHENQVKNGELDQSIYTFGINYSPENGVIFKSDFEFYNNKSNKNYRQLNLGVGIWF